MRKNTTRTLAPVATGGRAPARIAMPCPGASLGPRRHAAFAAPNRTGKPDEAACAEHRVARSAGEIRWWRFALSGLVAVGLVGCLDGQSGTVGGQSGADILNPPPAIDTTYPFECPCVEGGALLRGQLLARDACEALVLVTHDLSGEGASQWRHLRKFEQGDQVSGWPWDGCDGPGLEPGDEVLVVYVEATRQLGLFAWNDGAPLVRGVRLDSAGLAGLADFRTCRETLGFGPVPDGQDDFLADGQSDGQSDGQGAGPPGEADGPITQVSAGPASSLPAGAPDPTALPTLEPGENEAPSIEDGIDCGRYWSEQIGTQGERSR